MLHSTKLKWCHTRSSNLVKVDMSMMTTPWRHAQYSERTLSNHVGLPYVPFSGRPVSCTSTVWYTHTASEQIGSAVLAQYITCPTYSTQSECCQTTSACRTFLSLADTSHAPWLDDIHSCSTKNSWLLLQKSSRAVSLLHTAQKGLGLSRSCDTVLRKLLHPSCVCSPRSEISSSPLRVAGGGKLLAWQKVMAA